MAGDFRVPGPGDRGAEEDGVEDEGDVEDDVGGYCTVDEPFDEFVVVDGEDSAEEEEEGCFDAERDREI